MINILFSGNEKVGDGVLTCMLSIFKRTKTLEPFKFFVLTMDITRIKQAYTPISDEMIAFLDLVAKSYNPDSQVVKIDVGDIYDREFARCPNEMAYCSPYTLLRLFIDLIPEIPDKILYLDIDIMFNRDIRLLYDIDLDGYEYAAARDHYGKFLLNPNYINAGVLLFNMREARKTKLFEKARRLIKTKKFLFADQSALYNATTRKKMLSQRYNDQKFLYRKTIIRHFSKRLFYLPYPHIDNIKQWHIAKVHAVFGYHSFDDILDEYAQLISAFNIQNGETNHGEH